LKTPDVLRSLCLATSGGARRLVCCRFCGGVRIWLSEMRDLVSIASGGGGGWHSALGGAVSGSLRRLTSGVGLRVRRWAVLPPLASGCCRRFLALPPEVFRRLLMVPTAVNFQWWQILRGGFAEFFAFRLRTSANLQMLARLISPATSGASGEPPPEPPQF
jgi:hypothetical protein